MSASATSPPSSSPTSPPCSPPSSTQNLMRSNILKQPHLCHRRTESNITNVTVMSDDTGKNFTVWKLLNFSVTALRIQILREIKVGNFRCPKSAKHNPKNWLHIKSEWHLTDKYWNFHILQWIEHCFHEIFGVMRKAAMIWRIFYSWNQLIWKNVTFTKCLQKITVCY